MNSTLKRAALACLLMFGLLMLNINYLQVVRADGLSDDPRNVRNFFDRYSVERGLITAGGKEIIAKSVDTGDNQFRFQRQYPDGKIYAPVTGFFAPESESAVERAENSHLNGSSPDLLIRRSIDLVTSKTSKGANVDVTINPAAQKAAYKALGDSGKRGALIAMDPSTGAILAMVSIPTYDPNLLVSPDKAKVNKAYQELSKDKVDSPLLNRAIDRTYPPGSTFKVVTTAAYLDANPDADGQTIVEAPTRLDLPNTTADLPNFGGAACGTGRVPLVYALERSCNTPFGIIGMELGYDKMSEQVKKFGVGTPLTIPMGVAASDFGKQEDQAALAQASIGQRSNQMTPIEMAMIAAGIANDGVVKKPYLINRVSDSEGNVVYDGKSEEEDFAEPMSSEVAAKLRQMMVSVVDNGTADAAKIPGVAVGGKTGTAQTAPGQAPHAWFICFAPEEKPKIAIAVIVESGSAGDDASGGHTAAPIARQVIEAVLGR